MNCKGAGSNCGGAGSNSSKHVLSNNLQLEVQEA